MLCSELFPSGRIIEHRGPIDTPVYHNPTPRAFVALASRIGELRGTLNGPDLWFWSALEATHGELDKQLGISSTDAAIVDLRIYSENTPVTSFMWRNALVNAGAFKWGAYLRAPSKKEPRTWTWNGFPAGQAIAREHPLFSLYLAAAASG